MHVSVCICTFKRPVLLKKLLQKLAEQKTEGLFTFSAVVTDNDREQSARHVVDECAASLQLRVKYCCEPEQNIALARNCAVRNAEGDFIAFIDDDEFPPADWLLNLVKVCESRKVAGVLAPVRPFFETEPPAWLVQGRFCERPEYVTGYVLAWRETRTGNVLFRREILRGVAEPFRPEFGNGGEDQEFFRRMMERGATFMWCNEAAVHEVVPPERWRRRYLLKRALQRGQCETGFADWRSICKSLIAVPLYLFLLPFLLLGGHDRFVKYSIRLCDHTGKLLGVAGLKPMGSKYYSGHLQDLQPIRSQSTADGQGAEKSRPEVRVSDLA